jgi:hypothetical protein
MYYPHPVCEDSFSYDRPAHMHLISRIQIFEVDTVTFAGRKRRLTLFIWALELQCS